MKCVDNTDITTTCRNGCYDDLSFD